MSGRFGAVGRGRGGRSPGGRGGGRGGFGRYEQNRTIEETCSDVNSTTVTRREHLDSFDPIANGLFFFY
jgi:hypothetical protein